MRRGWLASAAAVVVLAMAGVAALTYQPFVHGLIGAYDEHLLIDVQGPDTGSPITQYRYRFHAATSYYTILSLRNGGPLPVTVLGIDPKGVLALIPSIEPVELRYGSTNDNPNMVVTWASAEPFTEAVVAPDAELTLWIRWAIGPCQPPGVRSYMANSGVARDSIPLRWSVLGIPRFTAISLGYTVAFEVTPEDFATECEPAAAVAVGQANR